jgi:hypothetical protein
MLHFCACFTLVHRFPPLPNLHRFLLAHLPKPSEKHPHRPNGPWLYVYVSWVRKKRHSCWRPRVLQHTHMLILSEGLLHSG